jgi:uncharacterized membrane protein YhaH (DUF805 family)
MKITKRSSRGIALMWAYLAHHAKKAHDRDTACWMFLFTWAKLGGKTNEVPVQFGGTATKD